MLSGVAKSGSPISRWTTRRPPASRWRALASTSNAPSVPSRSIRLAKWMPMCSVNPPESAAVDPDRLAGDVGGMARTEERAGGAELLRVAHPAGRDGPYRLDGVGVQLSDPVRQDGPWRQVVDRHPIPRHLGGDRLGHRGDRRAERVGEQDVR